jgi:hypothetical protein
MAKTNDSLELNRLIKMLFELGVNHPENWENVLAAGICLNNRS